MAPASRQSTRDALRSAPRERATQPDRETEEPPMPDRFRSGRTTALAWSLACAFVAALIAGGCASIPGDTGQAQAVSIAELEQKTLADLERQQPRTKDEIAASYGYVIMNNTLTKIPLVGVGAGYGVGVNRGTSARTYLRMRRFDLGFGVGVRAVRPVMIFQDSTKFRKFVD